MKIEGLRGLEKILHFGIEISWKNPKNWVDVVRACEAFREGLTVYCFARNLGDEYDLGGWDPCPPLTPQERRRVTRVLQKRGWMILIRSEGATQRAWLALKILRKKELARIRGKATTRREYIPGIDVGPENERGWYDTHGNFHNRGPGNGPSPH